MYTWADVAFVQTPQRFPGNVMPDDPLGNHSRTQYDITFVGKDGIGATPSVGQGCVWRVDALLGYAPSGASAILGNPKSVPRFSKMVGRDVGFRAQTLIEDTHTALEVFRRGWRSVYVNEPDEVLAMCTHPPDSLRWRTGQLFRWHMGAAQLLLLKGPWYPLFGRWPTVWHRVFCWDMLTYYAYAFPGYMLLIMPVVFGSTGVPPLTTSFAHLIRHLVPFLLAAGAPDIIAREWRGVDSLSLARDEALWLSNLHVMALAAIAALQNALLSCGRSAAAWGMRAPAWPLFLAFSAQVVALAATSHKLALQGFAAYGFTFVSTLPPIGFALAALWPSVRDQLPGGHLMLSVGTKYALLVVAGALLAFALALASV